MHACKLRLPPCLVLLPVLPLLASPACADVPWLLPVGVSPASREMHDLHALLLWVCIAIALVVFGALAFALLRYRRSRGAVARAYRGNLRLELAWTLIPLLILAGIAVPSTQAVLALDDDDDAAMTIQATGFQWRWKYDYLDYEFSLFSSLATPWKAIEGAQAKGEHYLLEVDQPLVLPVGKKIRVLTTSNDVIHSWWVPALGVKRDAVPGFVNEAWTRIDKPGVYRGQCAELCGTNHGFMPIVVHAVTEHEFQRWLEQRADAARTRLAQVDKLWSRDELMARGAVVYEHNCAQCHGAEGQGQKGAFPGLRRSKLIRGSMDGHAEIVMYGRRNTAMQAYLRQLDDIDLAAVITFTRNAWGNDRFDMLQPRAVRALRAASEGGKR